MDPTVIFTCHILAGLLSPFSIFFLAVLSDFGIHLIHLPPRSILLVATFVHLHEMFAQVVPSVALFRHYFALQPSKWEEVAAATVSSSVRTPPTATSPWFTAASREGGLMSGAISIRTRIPSSSCLPIFDHGAHHRSPSLWPDGGGFCPATAGALLQRERQIVDQEERLAMREIHVVMEEEALGSREIQVVTVEESVGAREGLRVEYRAKLNTQEEMNQDRLCAAERELAARGLRIQELEAAQATHAASQVDLLTSLVASERERERVSREVAPPTPGGDERKPLHGDLRREVLSPLDASQRLQRPGERRSGGTTSILQRPADDEQCGRDGARDPYAHR